MENSTGYGPSSSRWNNLFFSGDERSFEKWEVKFLGYMRLKKLKSVILPAVAGEAELAADKNEEAFAELIQFLDDRSLSLIIRDAKDKGREAFQILRTHYRGKGKQRIITLYTELTSLVKSSTESLTDYIIKAETARAALLYAGETVSDSLLIAMVLKGLPSSYKPFSIVVTQSDKYKTFPDFKVALRDFEESEKLTLSDDKGTSVLKTSSHFSNRNSSSSLVTCYKCGVIGHKANVCRNKAKFTLWCKLCKSSSHSDKNCRRQNYNDKTNSLQEKPEDIEFAFVIDASDNNGDLNRHCHTSFLVDCGATSHIVNDDSNFVSFDDNFKPDEHFVQLADGSTNTVATKRGTVKISLQDCDPTQQPCQILSVLCLVVPLTYYKKTI